MIQIESENLCVKIDPVGAQVTSIFNKEGDIEYLWQRDANIWASSAPVPFPIIGKVKDDCIQIDGNKYPMHSNGIIRYENIPIMKQEKSRVEFLFINTEKTKKNYPYDCRVHIVYEVIESRVVVTSMIINDDKKDMFYNYAGHPGFKLPLYQNENINDYYIEFEKDEKLSVYSMSSTGQLLNELNLFLDNERRFFIRKELLSKEAIVFSNPKSTKVSLKSLRRDDEIVVSWKGFNNLALWTPFKENMPIQLLCIEPWVGHSDFKDYQGEFSKRHEIACLNSRKQKTYQYTMEFKHR